MGSNNPYDESLNWLPYSEEQADKLRPGHTPYWQQDQGGARFRSAGATTSQSQVAQMERLSPRPARMPKERAISLVQNLKMTLIVASIAIFGILSDLISTHLQGTQASQPSLSHSTDISSGIAPLPTATSPDSGNYFNQQQGGNYGFGNGGPHDGPGTGTHASCRNCITLSPCSA
jgi:hypothetical protein